MHVHVRVTRVIFKILQTNNFRLQWWHQFLDGSTALIPLPRRISKTGVGGLANRQQHRIEEIDEGILCAKQTCLKLTGMQHELFHSLSHLRREQLLPSAQHPAWGSLSLPVMRFYAIPVFLLMVFGGADAWGPGGKYAVHCPDRCSTAQCGSTQRCRRTVLDDCGCCQVCAAGRGEHCYRTVSGMHGVKCGPGLFCDFYKDEDDYGDEYGICKGTVCSAVCTCLGRWDCAWGESTYSKYSMIL